MLNVVRSKYMLPGMVALRRNGKVVWWGHISCPWEDVEFDSMEISETDYDRLNLRINGEECGTCKS